MRTVKYNKTIVQYVKYILMVNEYAFFYTMLKKYVATCIKTHYFRGFN